MPRLLTNLHTVRLKHGRARVMLHCSAIAVDYRAPEGFVDKRIDLRGFDNRGNEIFSMWVAGQSDRVKVVYTPNPEDQVHDGPIYMYPMLTIGNRTRLQCDLMLEAEPVTEHWFDDWPTLFGSILRLVNQHSPNPFIMVNGGNAPNPLADENNAKIRAAWQEWERTHPR